MSRVYQHGDVDEDGDEVVVCEECDGTGKGDYVSADELEPDDEDGIREDCPFILRFWATGLVAANNPPSRPFLAPVAKQQEARPGRTGAGLERLSGVRVITANKR